VVLVVRSDAALGGDAAGLLGLNERFVVPLVLIGLGLRELGHRSIKGVAAAEVRGTGDAVAGAGVGPGERGGAEAA
jgi:hypothetical protein